MFSAMVCILVVSTGLPEAEAAELQNKLEVLNNIMDQEVSATYIVQSPLHLSLVT